MFITLGICIVIFILSFFAPRHARRLMGHFNRRIRRAEHVVKKAPAVGRILRWPIKSTRKATIKSHELGRKSRDKAPF
jgi:hypothetical protein